VRYWTLAGILLLAFLLQSVVSSYLAIGGITPDFLLVVVVTYGLLFGWEVGLAAGVIGGLLIDLITPDFIGRHVLSYGVVGLVSGMMEGRVFKDNLLLAPVGGLIGSVASQLIIVFCFWLFGREVDPIGALRKTLLPAALYDMALTILVYSRIYKYYLYLKPDPRGTIVIRRQ
jgi:rod shape-determining protein MreD